MRMCKYQKDVLLFIHLIKHFVASVSIFRSDFLITMHLNYTCSKIQNKGNYSTAGSSLHPSKPFLSYL